jgi:hypothetical protein
LATIGFIFPLVLSLNVVPLVQAADADPTSARTSAGHTFNVCDYGATGYGTNLDTAGLNRAIEACSQAGGGTVLVPAGRFLSGTIHLRSHVTLFLEVGATLVATTNLSQYEQPSVPSFMPEAKWGKWHRALLVAENAEDVTVSGPGSLDGNKVFDPTGEEHMRGPHTLVFVGCRKFNIRDISIVDAANYAIFFQASDDVDIRNVKITGGWDGVHFRGAPGRWCHNVNITGCRFFTGDDSIAGRYWDNVVISDCTLNSACNGIRLIGPATHLLVADCIFYGPGERVHRTSSRSNMLSGVILQPGAWDRTEGLLDDVLLANNVMRDVASPVTIWTKPGNPVGKITISGLNATGVYRAAFSAESWSDLPITNLVLRNAAVEFNGGGNAEEARQTVNGPGVDARALPAWGLYARNVENLTLEDVRLSVALDDFRPAIIADGVQRLNLDDFRFTHVAGVTEPLVTTNVGKVSLRDTDLPVRP